MPLNMGRNFQYSLSALFCFTLCLALAISSILMYRRMEKAEKENSILRSSAGYDVKAEPVMVHFNWPINIDISCNITGTMKGMNCVACDYDSRITFRNDFSKDVKVHFPLLRMSRCSSSSAEFIYSAKLEPEFKANKTISLKPGESFSMTFAKHNCVFTDRDLLEGKESFDLGRWALVFGVPDGQNADEYLVGTILTNPIHWKMDKNCRGYGTH